MSTIPTTFSSPAAIRSHALSREDGTGANWFSRDAMRWHATRLLRGIAKGAGGRFLFIYSDDPGASIGRPCRRYRVAAYDARANRAETVGAFEGYEPPDAAREEMNRRVTK